MLAEQEIAPQALPLPHPAAKRRIHPAPVEIDQVVRQGHAHGQIGIAQLEAADAGAEPGAADRDRGAERKDILVLLAQRIESLGDAGEGCRERREEAAPGIRQLHTPFLAHEQRAAHAIFQLADLIADRSLRHPQFFGGAGKVLVPAGGFESADRGERGRARHAVI